MDIAICQDKNCPKRENCFRFMAEPNPDYQSYGSFKWDNGCQYYWELEKE